MCGIVAVIGSREAAPLLIDGLRKLEYRGYDTAGIATIEALEKVHQLALSLGCRWVTSKAELHDEAVSLISHLPVFISAALLKTLHTEQDSSLLSLSKDLALILNFVEQLNKLDTKKTKPLTSIIDKTLEPRNDKINDGKIKDQILKNSPDKNEEFFIVPKVVE